MMQPLHVKAQLSTPVAVYNPFGFIPFDEIIVEAALRRRLNVESMSALFPMTKDIVIPSLSTEDSGETEREAVASLGVGRPTSRVRPRQPQAARVVPDAETIARTRIPLAKGGTGRHWYWRASFGVCASDDDPHSANDRSAQINSKTYLIKSSVLEWWCMGDKNAIEELLSTMRTIGELRLRYGSVHQWQVLRTNRDWAVWQSERLMRSVPYEQVPASLRGCYWPAWWGLRPPYSHPANQVEVALPSCSESACDGDLQTDDIVRWRDMTLCRSDRTLTFGEQRWQLTATETALLALLIEARGQPVWRGTIMRRLWPGHTGQGETRASVSAQPPDRAAARNLDVYVHRLRSYIEDNPCQPRRLITLRGWGFVLRLA